MKFPSSPSAAKYQGSQVVTLLAAMVQLWVLLFVLVLPGVPEPDRQSYLFFSAALVALAALPQALGRQLGAASRAALLLAEVPGLLVYRPVFPQFAGISLLLAALLMLGVAVRNFYGPEGWAGPRDAFFALPRVLDHGVSAAVLACLPAFLLIVSIQFQGLLPPQLTTWQAEPMPEDARMLFDPLEGRCHTLAKLEEDQWQGLRRSEKLEVLRTVADVERDRMGLPYDVVLISYPSGIAYGLSSFSSRTIVLNPDLLDEGSAESCLNTLLHEMRHIYQFATVQLYADSDNYRQLRIFGEAEKVYQNMTNYHSTSHNTGDAYDAYYNQYVETDARGYASRELDFYRAFLFPRTNTTNT